MKIAFIVGDFPALSETFVLNQITGLLDQGYSVDIFAESMRNEGKEHEDITKYDLIRRCRYRNTPKGAVNRILKFFPLFLKHVGMNPKVVLNSLNVFKYKKQALSLKLFYSVLPFLKHNDYDIVFCHFGPNGSLGVSLRETGAIKSKIITTFHGHDLSAYIKTEGKQAYRALFSKGDLFLPISDNWKSSLLEMGCPSDRIIVHRMGIDTDAFEFHKREHSNEKTRIVSVARLVEKKGIRYGIEAVAKLIEQNHKVEYLIIGDGPLRGELEQTIKEFGVQNHVKLVGWKTKEEINALLREADLFLAPSVTAADGDQEGIPVVLMEAMAIGLPVISTEHSGIPELVINDQTGMTVPEKDVELLYQKLVFLLNHPDERVRISRNGREFVEKHYNIHSLNQRLAAVFRKAAQL